MLPEEKENTSRHNDVLVRSKTTLEAISFAMDYLFNRMPHFEVQNMVRSARQYDCIQDIVIDPLAPRSLE